MAFGFKKKKKEKEPEGEEGAEKDEKEEPKEKEEASDAEGGEGGEAKPEEGEGEGGKSKKKLIIIAAAAVLVLAGGGAGLYFSGVLKGGHSTEEAATEESKVTAKEGQPVYYDLPQILVNLNTGGKQTSFIKATVTFELSAPTDVPIVEANLPKLMDSYNTFLREMRATDLYGSTGVYRLREEMLSRGNKILAPVKVKDVLFKEILVQ